MIICRSLSYSTVSSFLMCPMKIRYEKIDQLNRYRGTSTKQLFGTALHSAIAARHRALFNGVVLGLDDLVRIFRIKFESVSPENLSDNDLSPEQAGEEARVLLELFLAADLPKKVDAVELPIRYAMTSTLDCVGQVDLILRDEGMINIVDVKSTTKSPTEDQVMKYEEQCLTYAMKYQQPVRAKIWLFLRRKKGPEFKVIDLDVERVDYSELIEKFMGVAKAISNNIFFKNRGWHCKSCPFSYMCEMRAADDGEEEMRAAA